MKKKLILLMLLCLLSVLTLSIITTQIQAQTSIEVLLVGEDIEEALLARLSLDPMFVITESDTIGSDISGYDSIIILDYAPTTAEINLLGAFAGGIAVFIYTNLASNATLLTSLGLASSTNGTITSGNYSLPVPVSDTFIGDPHPILENIQWNSVPTITNYTNIQLEGTILIETSDISDDPNLALIATSGNDKHFVFNFFPSMDFNQELVEWPFFN